MEYSGELNKPFDQRQWEQWVTEAGNCPVKRMEAAARINTDHLFRYYDKMLLLMDEHGVPRTDPDRWEWLAYRLAFAHVRGFRTEDGPLEQLMAGADG
jgi:hypothetical protein